jgi:hypothetical protein
MGRTSNKDKPVVHKGKPLQVEHSLEDQIGQKCYPFLRLAQKHVKNLGGGSEQRIWAYETPVLTEGCFLVVDLKFLRVNFEYENLTQKVYGPFSVWF